MEYEATGRDTSMPVRWMAIESLTDEAVCFRDSCEIYVTFSPMHFDLPIVLTSYIF